MVPLSRLIKVVLRPILGPLRKAVMRVSVRLIPRTEMNGFEFTVFSGHAHRDLFVRKMAEALNLIETYDPRRFKRIQRDLRRFALVKAGGDYFDPDIDTHVVDLANLERLEVTHTALAVVHESTHARLLHCGIPYGPELAARIEAACVGQEVAFAQRLPDSSSLVESIGRKLEVPWWTQDQWKKRMSQQLASYLPEWRRKS